MNLNNIQSINLIVVHPFGRGGSIFFQSLLDSHKNIITLPCKGELIYSFINTNITLLKSKNFNTIVDLFIKHFPIIFDTRLGYLSGNQTNTSGAFGKDNKEHIITSTNLFKKRILTLINLYFNDLSTLSRKDFFILLHLSFFDLEPKKINNIKYIVYHPHNIHTWKEMKDLIIDFPDMYFIGMTRNPISDWNSFKKLLKIRNISSIKAYYFYSTITYILNIYLFSLIQEKIKNKMMMDLIKFHKLNKKAMEKISRWLNIEFQPSLLKSTLCGKAWAGNLSSRQPTDGFNENKTDIIDSLSKEEIYLHKTLVNNAGMYLHYNINDTYGDKKHTIPYLALLKNSLYFYMMLPIKHILKSNHKLKVLRISKRILYTYPKILVQLIYSSYYLKKQSLKKDIFL